VIRERHRHRYEFNNRYLQKMMNAGCGSPASRATASSRSSSCRSIPFFVASQFHPEFPLDPARRPSRSSRLRPRGARLPRSADAGALSAA
jgi:CTP synthase (UTP-ammonia lyase)